MKQYRNKGSIFIKGKFDIEYNVCEIEYIVNEDDTYKYIFRPNYSLIDLVDPYYFRGIPGLNLELRKEEYVRENIKPTFISERVPQKNREDYLDLLKEVDMEFMEPIIYLTRTKKRYSGDKLYVKPYEEKQTINYSSFAQEKGLKQIKNMLALIAKGDNLVIDGNIIDDSNRKLIHDVLLNSFASLLENNKELQRKGIEKAKEEGKYKGRKPKEFDFFFFLELVDKVSKKELTARKAAQTLGISIDKYYRELKKLNNN